MLKSGALLRYLLIFHILISLFIFEIKGQKKIFLDAKLDSIYIHPSLIFALGLLEKQSDASTEIANKINESAIETSYSIAKRARINDSDATVSKVSLCGISGDSFSNSGLSLKNTESILYSLYRKNVLDSFKREKMSEYKTRSVLKSVDCDFNVAYSSFPCASENVVRYAY